MSSYFFGGFSAYWIVPSGRFLNHSGCSPTHGWSGAHWKAMSSAISMPRSRAERSTCRKSAAVPSSGWIAVWPPSAAPIAHGLPTSPGPAAGVLFLPLRFSRPIGWMGGRYTTSNPIAAMASKRSSRSAKVPCFPGSGEAERGKSSYHVLNRARSRSTTTVSVGDSQPPARGA